MKNLTTRKIVFGMLVTFVLAFSVQGIADALTFKESRSGDLQTLLPGEEFTIKFSINPGGSGSDIFDDFTPKKRQVTEDLITLIDSSGYTVKAVTTKRHNKVFSSIAD